MSLHYSYYIYNTLGKTALLILCYLSLFIFYFYIIFVYLWVLKIFELIELMVFFNFNIFIYIIQIVKNIFLNNAFAFPPSWCSCSRLNWTFFISFQTVVSVLVSQTVFLRMVLVLGRITMSPHSVGRTTTDRSRRNLMKSHIFLLSSHTVRKIALRLPVQQWDSQWKILIFYSDHKIQ